MGKPSIFSREYDRKMKARKRIKTVIILSLIAAAVIFVTRATFLNWLEKNTGNLRSKDKGSSNYLSEKNGNDRDKGTTAPGSEANKGQGSNETKPIEPAEITEKIFELNMPDGKKIKMLYSEENGNKIIKNVLPEDNSIQFFINPSANKVVLLNASQDMYIGDLEGNIINITRSRYVTTAGVAIEKAPYLQKHPEFLWHSSPKFINDNTVVYITQLTWFGKTRYVYKVDLNKASVHTKVQGIQGENVSFETGDPKGLKVNLDDVTKFIGSDGNVIQ